MFPTPEYMKPVPLCYVRGCYQPVVLCAIHRQGRCKVPCCKAHNPDRFGQALNLWQDRPAELPEPEPEPEQPPATDINTVIVNALRDALTVLMRPTEDDRPDGGTKVPRRPIPPTIPPAPALCDNPF